MKKPDFFTVLYGLSAVLLCLAIVLFFQKVPWAVYLFIAGALGYLACHLKHAYKGGDFRIKRLNRLFVFNVLLLVGSAYLMWNGNNAFMVLMLLLAVLEFFMNWRADWYARHPLDDK